MTFLSKSDGTNFSVARIYAKIIFVRLGPGSRPVYKTQTYENGSIFVTPELYNLN